MCENFDIVHFKAETYEWLLENAASEGKKCAGQYFTPQIMIPPIVRCMKPDILVYNEFTICDPAADTGGFLMCSYEWLMEKTKGGLMREDAGRTERFKKFTIEEIEKRDYNLDIFWLKDETLEDADNLPEPDERAGEVIAHLEASISGLQEVLVHLGEDNNGLEVI